MYNGIEHASETNRTDEKWMKDASMPEIKLMGESIKTLGAQNRDERCRTMKGQVGGVLEESDNETTVKGP